MERLRLQQDSDLYLQDGFWNLRWREDALDANLTGPAALEKFLSRLEGNARVPESEMTIADFVRNTFVPEHVEAKGLAGRTHFQAILKHVLTPEEVVRIFHGDIKKARARLKAVPHWPYMDNLRLCDARPDHLQRLISAASTRGYSAQTVTHIRNVVTAIFALARKKLWFTADNPGSLVTLPKMRRKEPRTLTLAQVKEVLGAMRYPEKEIALVAMLTRMSVPEICGLQWKRVNVTGDWVNADGEPVPPNSIAVRKQWHCGRLDSLDRTSRSRDLPIPESLLPTLRELSRRAKFTSPDDFVLASRAGTAVDKNNVAAHRLKRLGQRLQIPWLSWYVLRRTGATLAQDIGIHFLGDRVAR